MIRKYFSTIKQWFAQYTREQLLAMIQGTMVLWITGAILFPKTIYTGFSYDGRGTYMPLVINSLLTFFHYTGNGVYMSINFIIGFTISCLLNMLIMVITYAANNANLDDTATKYVVFILLMSVIMGGINAIRWQYDSVNWLCFITAMGIVMTNILSNMKVPFHYDEPWYILAQVIVGIVIYVFCVALIFPVTSGYKYRLNLRTVMNHVSSAIKETSNLMMEPVNSENGLPVIASGVMDDTTGWDTGLKDKIASIRKHASTSRSILASFIQLNLEVWLEIDVYFKPHLFPHIPMQQVKLSLWNSVRSLALVVRQLQAGHEDLSFLNHTHFRKPMQDLLDAMSAAYLALGDVMIDPHPDKTGSILKADECLQHFDAQWQILMENLSETFENHSNSILASDEHKRFGMLNICGALYLFSSKLRMLYGTVAGAVNGRSKDAVSLAARRFQMTGTLKRVSEVLAKAPIRQQIAMDNTRSSISILQLLESRADEDELQHVSLIMPSSRWHSSKSKQQRPPLLRFPFIIGGFGRSSTLKSVYYVPLGVLLFGQMAISIAIGTSFASIPVIVDNVFNGGGVALLSTILAVYMPSIGLIELRMLYRFLGTVTGAVASYVIVAFAYLINGLSWENHPAKIIIVMLLIGAWCGFLNGTAMRYPPHSYGFMVSSFTVALVVGPSVYSTEAPWKPIAYRILETIIGMVIVTVGALILPISVYSQVKSSFNESLRWLAELVKTVPGQLEAVDSPTTKSIIHKHKTDPETFEAYYNQSHVKPIKLATRIELHLSKIQANFAALDAEYTTLTRLFPKTKERLAQSSAIADAKEALQACASFTMLMYDLKIENSPDGPMPIPEWLLVHVENVTAAMAECLDSLRECMRGKKKVSHAMDQISILDTALREQLKDCISDESHSLSIQMMFMLYIGLGFSQQIRLLWKSCIKAFLLGADEDDLELINKKAAEQCAFGPDVWIESILAMALDY